MMLQCKLIEPASTDWASHIFFALKKDVSFCFRVVYLYPNAVTVRDAYPLERMEKCINSLGEARMLLILNANSGYWQIEIDKRSR